MRSCLLLVWAALASVWVAGCSGSGSEDLTAGRRPGETEVTAPLALSVTGPDRPAAVQVDVGFDEGRYRFLRVQSGTSAQAAGKDVQAAVVGAGQVRVLVFGMNETAMDAGALATLVFADAQGSVQSPSLQVTHVSAADGSGSALTAAAVATGVEVR